jgi:hypothetical protein
MIPDFTTSGILPPGIHSAAWAEFAERFIVFQDTDQRLRVGERLRAVYDEACLAGIVKRFLVAGSYVTAKAEPIDFDCLLVLDPAIVSMQLRPFQYNLISRRMSRRLFGGDVLPAIDGSPALQKYLDFFSTTRDGEQAGIVEVQL